MAMSAQGWRRKACTACTSSKRQCNKQTPACRRCRDRGIPCHYPVVKRISAPLESVWTLPDTPPSGGTSPGWFDFDATAILRENQAALDAASGTKFPLPEGTEWFLGPETWEVEYSHPKAPADSRVLQDFVTSVQGWLRQWVSEGENPFIHSHLYIMDPPRAIQNVYSALTAYLSKNTKNECLTFKIIEDRAAELLQPPESPADREALAVDIFAQLARVQALLVYQAIRLFDGNIRARAQGEAALPVLLQWLQELWTTARQDFAHGWGGVEAECRWVSGSLLAGAGGPALAWRMWLVAESVRRTWLTAKTLMGTYLVIRDGRTECPGGAFFTARRGLWEAPTWQAWAKLAAGGGKEALFMQSMDMESLCDTVESADVDEFGRVWMSTAFGCEKTWNWIGDLESLQGWTGNDCSGLFAPAAGGST
jgi:hypothetical protein